jgi:hypothetical protein
MYNNQFNIIKQKVEELKVLYKCEIIPLIVSFENELIVGYVKEPNRYQKSLSIAKIPKSIYLGGIEILDNCLIKNESDPRLYSDDQQYDNIIFCAAFKVMDEVIKLNNKTSFIIKKCKEMVANSGDAQICAMIRYYFKIDPDALTDEQFYMRWSEIDWLISKGITDAKYK